MPGVLTRYSSNTARGGDQPISVAVSAWAHAWPKQDIKVLYKQRWDVEVNFRHLKVTMGMQCLRAKTPAMNEKEIWAYLLAYNLIRWLMLNSAKLADRSPRSLSFKHTVQLWRSVRAAISRTRSPDDDVIHPLLGLIAQSCVGHRPGRIEPRAIKRRPKPYALLMMPRPQARQSLRRSGHPKRKYGESMKRPCT